VGGLINLRSDFFRFSWCGSKGYDISKSLLYEERNKKPGAEELIAVITRELVN